MKNFKLKVSHLFLRVPPDIRNFIILSLTSGINHSIRLFTGVVNAKLLTPALYGLNTFATILIRYIGYLHFGAQSGLNRQIPIDIGSKKITAINTNLMTVFWYLCFISIFILSTFVLLFFLDVKFSVLPRNYYFDIAFMAISSLFYAYFNSYLISTQQYKILSSLKIKFETPLIIVSVFLVYFLKLHGLFLGFVIVQTTFCFQTVIVTKFKFKSKISLSVLLKLIKPGLPIMVGSFIYVFFTTLDIVFLSSHVNARDLGVYGLALTGVAAYRVYATSFSDILSPKMGKLYGENQNSSKVLFGFINKYNDLVIISLGIIVTFFFFAIPPIIFLFLKEYIQSVELFKVLLLGAFALSIYIPSGIAITILKKNIIFSSILLLISLLTFLAYKYGIHDNFMIQTPNVLFLASLLFSLIIISITTFFSSGKFQFKFKYDYLSEE